MAFCGIGTPDHFRQTLQALKVEIVAFAVFPDHHPYTRLEIEQLIKMANQHDVATIVTTEKDGIRLRGLQLWTKQVWELRVRTTIVAQEAAWETSILNTVKT